MAAQAVAVANVQTYLRRVKQLHAHVREWMTELEPDSQFSEREIELSEEATGRYKARVLEIATPGRPAIRLVPRGATWLERKGGSMCRAGSGVRFWFGYRPEVRLLGSDSRWEAVKHLRSSQGVQCFQASPRVGRGAMKIVANYCISIWQFSAIKF